MSVLLFDTFNGCFSPIKEINRLKWNGMECQTFTSEENWRFQNIDFLGKKIWKRAPTLKSIKVQGIFWGTFILALSFSAIFSVPNRLSNFF